MSRGRGRKEDADYVELRKTIAISGKDYTNEPTDCQSDHFTIWRPGLQ